MIVDKNLVFAVEELVASIILQDRHQADTAFNEKFPTLISILQSQLELPVDDALAMMQRVSAWYTLAMLKGEKISDFNMNLFKIVNEPGKKIPFFHNGILKYIIKTDASQRKTEEIESLGYNSKYVGKAGDKLVLSLRIMRCTRIHSPGQYDFYSAVGITEDGNLFNFSPKSAITPTDGYTYRISCKVKSHHSDNYLNGYNVTRVNYCRELEACK